MAFLDPTSSSFVFVVPQEGPVSLFFHSHFGPGFSSCWLPLPGWIQFL